MLGIIIYTKIIKGLNNEAGHSLHTLERREDGKEDKKQDKDEASFGKLLLYTIIVNRYS